jgi:hypothetical protein
MRELHSQAVGGEAVLTSKGDLFARTALEPSHGEATNQNGVTSAGAA